MEAPLLRGPVQEAILVEGIIRNLALFIGVDHPAIRQTVFHSELKRLSRGEMILRRGEPVPGVLAVAYGSVKTRLRHPQGSEVVLRLLGPGETFAEAPVLLGGLSKLDAVALGDTMLVLIAAPWVRSLAERDAPFSRNLVNALAVRTQTLLAELETGLQRSAQRLAAYIISIAQPAELPGTWTARLPVSKTLLAARLGVKKETLSRLLRQFVASGLISMAQRDIMILDRDRLLQTVTSPD